MECPYCHKDHADEALFCPETGQSLHQNTDICPHCHQHHPPDMRYCPTTGLEITPNLACPYCGNSVAGNPHYCSNCGSRISAESDFEAVDQQDTGWTKAQYNLSKFIIGLFVVCIIIIVIGYIVAKQSQVNYSNGSSPIFGQRIPPEVEETIRNLYAQRQGIGGWKLEKISEIEVTGKGKVPKDNYHAGIEEIYCANVKIDATQDYPGKYLWFSYYVYRIGNYWDISYDSSGQSWDIYACPGEDRWK